MSTRRLAKPRSARAAGSRQTLPDTNTHLYVYVHAYTFGRRCASRRCVCELCARMFASIINRNQSKCSSFSRFVFLSLAVPFRQRTHTHTHTNACNSVMYHCVRVASNASAPIARKRSQHTNTHTHGYSYPISRIRQSRRRRTSADALNSTCLR